ncbi:MAG: hypothetical protein IJT98_06210 [Prevotella sp.]|nr:hypothetical protein [Prevotella sp.]
MMKLFKNSLLTLLALAATSAYADRLYVEDAKVLAGGECNLNIVLDTDSMGQYCAFQFDLVLPQGITTGSSDFHLNEACFTDQQQTFYADTLPGGYGWRVVCMSPLNMPMTGQTDVISFVTVRADASLSEDSLHGSLQNIVFTRIDSVAGVQTERMDAADFSIKVEHPVTITAKSYTRRYGEENPAFEYVVTGGTFYGIPEIVCQASPESPVGLYDILVRQGTITNYDVVFVNGVLSVEKAPLAVIANDQAMEEDDELPVFTLRYEGFRLQDDESVLTSLPVATTTYAAGSGPGLYPITVSGGDALNYALTYQDGILTVTESSGIGNVQAAGLAFSRQADGVITIAGVNVGETVCVYDVSGRMVSRQQADGAGKAVISLASHPKGIYSLKIGPMRTLKVQNR